MAEDAAELGSRKGPQQPQSRPDGLIGRLFLYRSAVVRRQSFDAAVSEAHNLRNSRRYLFYYVENDSPRNGGAKASPKCKRADRRDRDSDGRLFIFANLDSA